MGCIWWVVKEVLERGRIKREFALRTRPFMSAAMLASAKCSVTELAFVLPFWLRDRGFSGDRSGRGGGGQDGHACARHLELWLSRW